MTDNTRKAYEDYLGFNLQLLVIGKSKKKITKTRMLAAIQMMRQLSTITAKEMEQLQEHSMQLIDEIVIQERKAI